jgi:nitroreductase
MWSRPRDCAAVEVHEAISTRRMTRAFERTPIEPATLGRVLDAARAAPSAGNTQALDLLVIDDPERYWTVTFADAEKRRAFRWQRLFDAPVLVVPYVEPAAYDRRYAEADKVTRTSWPVPYWFVDGGMAVQNLLLAAHAHHLGALFFGQFEHEAAVRRTFGVPDDRRALGTVALGHRTAAQQPGRSHGRPRRAADETVHRGHW